MSKTRKKRSSTRRHAHKAAARRPKSNPARRSYSRGRRRGRRNPAGAVSRGGVGGLITSAAYAIAGAVGSKYLTQAVLGSSNTGYVGYAANLAAAFIVGKGVGMVTKNKQTENTVILGGVIQVLLRFLIDQTPFGSKLSSIGMGDYQATTIFSPVRYSDPMRSAAVDLPSSIQPRLAAAPAPAGMQGLGARSTYSRSNSTY